MNPDGKNRMRETSADALVGGAALASQPPYEIRVDEDKGFVLSEGARPWKGWRVRYRPLGSRGRWTKFLTETDLSNYGVGQLQEICALHAGYQRGTTQDSPQAVPPESDSPSRGGSGGSR